MATLMTICFVYPGWTGGVTWEMPLLGVSVKRNVSMLLLIIGSFFKFLKCQEMPGKISGVFNSNTFMKITTPWQLPFALDATPTVDQDVFKDLLSDVVEGGGWRRFAKSHPLLWRSLSIKKTGFSTTDFQKFTERPRQRNFISGF